MDFRYDGHANSPGLYKITNLVNDRFYIGSTYRFKQRWNEHARELKRGKQGNAALQADYNLHGPEAFRFEVLEVIERKGDRLNAEEELIAKHFDRGGRCYNAKIKMHPYTLGMKFGPLSNERRAEMSLARLGKTPSDETRAKLRAACKKRDTPEYRARLSAALLGREFSDAWKENLRLSHLGKKQPVRAVVTEETRAKHREAALGRTASAETREKMCAAQKAAWVLRRERRS